MDEITFGKADPKDALRLSLLFKQVYIHTYGLEGITHEFTRFVTKRFAPAFIEKTILENPDQLTVAYFKDNPIGIAEVHLNSQCKLRKTIAPELDKFYLLDRFNGKGIGYGLLTYVEKRLIEKGYNELWLEVYFKNDRAIKFYERQGYQSIGSVDFIIENSAYENYVMTKELNI